MASPVKIMEKTEDPENPENSDEIAAASPDNSHCLLCHSRVGVSSRTCVEIFTKNLASEDRPVAYTIGAVLGGEVGTQSFHSHVICKKCYKLLYELDEIESRASEIKGEIMSSYKHTLEVRLEEKNAPPESENTGGDKLTVITEENSIKYKIVTTKGRKKALPKKTLPIKDNTDGSEQQKENVVCEPDEDGGDHPDSDSDYVLELPGVEEGHELTVEHDGDQIVLKIKMEPDDHDEDDSIIIKKKGKVVTKDEEVELPDKLVSKDDADFACCICPEENRVTMDMKGVIAHLKAEHQIRVYICDICCQVFKKRNDLSEHLDEHVATEEGDFQCETCNRIFTNLRLFRVHKRMHYPQNKMWTCESCGKRYSSRNLLEEHMNTHTGTRPYMCTVCGKDFASKYTFKAHSKTHEVRPRPFACDECSKSFLSVQNLQQHQRTHNGMRNFVCEQCGKAFGTARNLEVHTVVHSGYKPYICRACGKAFARKAEIRDHERTHTGEKPYQCEFCGATFSQRSNLQSHKRATHYQDKRYKCGVCSKGFKRRRLLDYHMKAVHTGERPFKCNICDATFVYPEHFKKHRRIHTGEKPFHCEVCGKAFNSRDNRNAHRFVHSDKKPYECLVCGAGFMRKPLLYNHMQSQGHLNDTIVVNQPRLTTDDDLMMEASVADLEGDEDEEDHVLEMISEGGEDVDNDTKLYISELKERGTIEGTEEGHYITGEQLESEGEETGAAESLIVDGDVHYTHHDEIVTIHGDVVSEEVDDDGRTRMVVVPATPRNLSDLEECYEEQVVEMHEGEELTSEQEIVQVEGEGGAVQLIQIQLQESDGSSGKRWYNIVNQ